MSIYKAAGTLLVGLVAAVGLAHAGPEYPNRAIKVLVGYAPGGTPDVIARTICEKLQAAMGQPFVIDNRPGAGGTLATAVLAKSPNDGYTIMVADVGQLGIAPHLFKTLSYDPIKDIQPISMAGISPMFIVANAKTSPAKTLQELIAQAKAKPGTLDYGSAGLGSIHQIAMEVFKANAGIDIRHVPYKGSGQSVPALLSGDVPIIMSALPAVGSFATNGQVRLLAVTSEKRYPETPDVPSISEMFPGYDYPSEIGVIAPAGTPMDIVMKLSKAIAQIENTPEMREKFKALGSVPVWSTPESFTEDIKRNLAKYGAAIKQAGIEPQ